MNRIGSIFLGIIAICLIVGLFTWRGPGEVGSYIAGATVEGIQPAETPSIKPNTTKTIALTLKETAGKKAMVTSVSWILYDKEENPIGTGTENFIPPKEIGGGGEISVEVDVDCPPGATTGTGTLQFTAAGYDTKYGNPINGIPGYSSIEITPP